MRRCFERNAAIKIAVILSKPRPLPKSQSPFYLTPTLASESIETKIRQFSLKIDLDKSKWNPSH